MKKLEIPIGDVILEYLNDGLYVCDTERRIIYWSKSAERITGWTQKDVVGNRCRDNILEHVDKDGRRLCGEEFCPLHRSMCTNKRSSSPLIVFGKTKTGKRLPMAVSVAPVHDADGKVAGGIETFTDFSETYATLERAKLIQTLSMEHDLPKDERVRFSTFYIPHDIIGGDFFTIRQLDPDHYCFFLADVTGHGVSAALYTIHLSSLWGRYFQTLRHPATFAEQLNRDLCRVVQEESFATGICGVLDAAKRTVRVAWAGGPSLVLVRSNGLTEKVDTQGMPFGLMETAVYEESEFRCAPGDRLLMFTDGAIEIHNAAGNMLGTEGLIRTLTSLGYPKSGVKIEPLHKALLSFSNEIRLEDDLTLVEVRFSS